MPDCCRHKQRELQALTATCSAVGIVEPFAWDVSHGRVTTELASSDIASNLHVLRCLDTTAESPTAGFQAGKKVTSDSQITCALLVG